MKTKFYSWFDNYTAKGSREMYCKDGWNASEKNRSGALDKRIKKLLRKFIKDWKFSTSSGYTFCKHCEAEIFFDYEGKDICYHSKKCQHLEAKKLLKKLEALEA
jgi:hypothetical protein